MTDPRANKVLLGRLYETTSGSGNRYFVGRLGAARVVLFKSRDCWELYVQDGGPQEQGAPAADPEPFGKYHPRGERPPTPPRNNRAWTGTTGSTPRPAPAEPMPPLPAPSPKPWNAIQGAGRPAQRQVIGSHKGARKSGKAPTRPPGATGGGNSDAAELNDSLADLIEAPE